MSWQDAGDIRKKRGGKLPKGEKHSAEDAKRIVKNDPAYKSMDNPKNKRKARLRRNYKDDD